jgi:hypothetical protein
MALLQQREVTAASASGKVTGPKEVDLLLPFIYTSELKHSTKLNLKCAFHPRNFRVQSESLRADKEKGNHLHSPHYC